MVHISQTYSYRSISVYTRIYACVCVHLQFTSQIRAHMTSICPCVNREPTRATPADSVAGYWQLVTDTSNMIRYEQDMCMCVFAQICGVYVRICSNLWRWYWQIQTDLNVYKQQKNVFLGRLFIWRPYLVHIRQYLVHICSYLVSMMFICFNTRS